MALLLTLLLLLTELGGVFAMRIRSTEATDEGQSVPVISSILSGGPAITARAAVVMEVHSGAVLFEKNCTLSMSPISLTKLLTDLIVFEEGSMTDTVSCSYTAINGIGKKVTRVGLVVDEKLSVQDLLYASLVASADEATYALAEHVGGSMKKFLKKMNDRMEQLGGVNSNFTSCIGTGTAKQTSCAYDLGLVACRLGCMNDFLTIASSKWYKIPATNLKEARTIAQTHKFIRQTLKYNYAIAGKSGGSNEEGEYALCTYAEHNGMRLVAIVLGSTSDETAYADSISILDYAFENYVSYSMKAAERISNVDYAGFFDECPMFTGKDHEMIYTEAGATIVVPHGADLSQLVKRVEYAIPEDYVHGENVIGYLIYSYHGTPIGRTSIIYYNEEFPLSQKDFNAAWPKFLLSPSLLKSVGGEGTESVVKLNGATKVTPTPTPKQKGIVHWEGTTKQTAGLKSGILFLALFLFALVTIYIIFPMLRKMLRASGSANRSRQPQSRYRK